MTRNVVIQRQRANGLWECCLAYSTLDNVRFESFVCDLVNAYDKVGQKYSHRYVESGNTEAIFIVLE